MVQILGGNELKNAFEFYNMKAVCKYHNLLEDICVWEISEENLNTLDNAAEEKWEKSFGWYRYINGTLMFDNYPLIFTTIKDATILAWYSPERYFDFLEKKGYNENYQKSEENAIENEYWDDHNFDNLLDYLKREWNVEESEDEITEITEELAKLNNLSLSQLWKLTMEEI